MHSRKGSAVTRRLVHLAVATLAIFPAALSGQICTGSASFTAGTYQVAAGAAFNDNAQSLSAGLAAGSSLPFGQVSVVRTTFDDMDGSALGVEGALGLQVPLGAARRVQFCPVAAVLVSSGPSDVDVFGDGSAFVDFTETDLSFGLAIGGVAVRSGTIQIIPSSSLAIVSAKVSSKEGMIGPSNAEIESYWLLSLGIGVVFSQKITLHPAGAIPFGLDGGSTSFGVSVGVSFGPRSGAP